jgi:lipoprotein-anchoring transpeptidase ErfK/SrfK
MTDTTLPIRDGALMPQDRKVKSEDGVITPYNAEHPEQRLALLAAVAASASAPGTPFTDKTVAALSAAQAAGTTAAIVANPQRRVFAITPTNDGRLYIASAAGNGFYWPLYAGVTRVLSGQDCPTNALFVTGQTVATALPMAEG